MYIFPCFPPRFLLLIGVKVVRMSRGIELQALSRAWKRMCAHAVPGANPAPRDSIIDMAAACNYRGGGSEREITGAASGRVARSLGPSSRVGPVERIDRRVSDGVNVADRRRQVGMSSLVSASLVLLERQPFHGVQYDSWRKEKCYAISSSSSVTRIIFRRVGRPVRRSRVDRGKKSEVE